MKIFTRTLCFILVGLCIFSFGCTGRQEDIKPIVIGINDDMVSFDAAATKDIVSETVARCVYTTLFVFDKELNLVPCLAESYEKTSDLEWIFKIRQNAKFHDGTPLTAEDVKYSIDRAMSIELAEKALLIIDKVEVVDQYTVKVTTTEPFASLPSVFVRVSTSIMSKKALEKPDYDFNKPIGSGPFKVIVRKEKDIIELERFDEYFLGPAKTKYMNFLVEPSEQMRTAALLNGDMDVVFRISSYDYEYLDVNESVDAYRRGSTKMEILQLNDIIEPIKDIRVRKAISYAINRQALIDNVLDGCGVPLNSMIAPPLVGSIELENFEYNPELAKQLLKEAGYEEGFDIKVLSFDMMRKKQLEYIKLDLAKVGINMSYEFLELEDYLDIITKNENVATLMSWTCNADPDSTFSQVYSKDAHYTVNHSRYTDHRVEELILEGKKESDTDLRAKIYEEANRIVADSYYILPLYQADVLVAASKTIGGVSINPQGIFAYEELYRIESEG